MANKASQVGINITTPIRFSDELPSATDLVVIGGGIVGVFTALYANRLGLKTLILEKGRIAGEQSSRNWGWCRQQGRDDDELPIMMEATRLWEEVDRQVDGRTGFTRKGCLFLAKDEAQLAELADWIKVAKAHDLETNLLSSAEIASCVDAGVWGGTERTPWAGGIWTPSDGRAEPWTAVPAVAELAHVEGVGIRENCAVRGLDITNGRVHGVITEYGPVRAEQVVLAGGAWSSLLLQHHGLFIPQLAVRASVAQTEVLPSFFEGTALDDALSFRRRIDGTYTLGDRHPPDLFMGRDALRSVRYYLPTLRSNATSPKLRLTGPKEFPDSWLTPRRWSEDSETPFERTRVLDPDPSPLAAGRLTKQWNRVFPTLGPLQIRRIWGGMVDTMPDIVPIIDHVTELDGLILATGMSGHGFGIGPGIGRVVAGIAAAKPSQDDISRFRYARFFDGSPVSLGPAI